MKEIYTKEIETLNPNLSPSLFLSPSRSRSLRNRDSTAPPFRSNASPTAERPIFLKNHLIETVGPPVPTEAGPHCFDQMLALRQTTEFFVKII